MSILTYPLGFIGGGKEFYNNVIENSIRWDDASNSYLSRAQTASDRRTWTHSSWVKFNPYSETSDTFAFFGAGADNTAQMYAATTSSDGLQFRYEVGNSVTFDFIENNNLFRDPSAWYHFVFVWDSNNSTGDDRVRAYVNGKRIPFSTEQTAGTQGTEGWINDTTYPFLLGGFRNDGLGNNHGYQTDIYFVDGYALGPENFGEYKEGAWIPKAYAGPPPLITDSSPQNTALQGAQGVSTFGVSTADYDQYYIGEASIQSVDDNTNAKGLSFRATAEHVIGQKEFTIEQWWYVESYGSPNGALIVENWADDDGYSHAGISASAGAGMQLWQSGTNIILYVNTGSSPSPNIFGSLTRPSVQEWHHYNVTRDQNALTLYVDGVAYGSNTDHGTSNSSCFSFGAVGQLYSIANQPSATASYSQNGYYDEVRMVIGDARPPRFYFGTPYGDASGGVLPQRATSAHRFTDDERTVLLVSGQSANGHARAVSLVDESGLHLDNVHTSNSSLTNYPTQDGVGKQLTISGPQHTTKESFVGNTSSILVNGIDDAVSIASGHSVPAGTTARTIDYWIKVHDHETYGYTFGHGGTSPGTTFGIAARGSTSANHDYFFQGWGSGDFDLPKPLAEVSQDWQHLQVTWDGTTTKVYVDGVFANSKNNSINTAASAFEIGRNGRGGTEYIGIYFDEFRASTSIEPPQIKWTHTQTAGAGNKNAYDVNGWRIHGHEFSDDNATSLLVHGDTYSSTAGYFDLRTNDTTSSYWNVTTGTDMVRSTSENYTIGFWIRTDNTRQYVWTIDNSGTADNNRYISTEASTGSYIQINGTALSRYGGTTSPEAFQYNDWNFITIRQSGTDVKVFHLSAINGGQIGTVSSLPSASVTNGTTLGFNVGGGSLVFNIGTYTAGQPDKFSGDIAGWAMWHESLPDQAIVDLYNAGFTHDLGTTTGTAYTSTQTGNLKRYYSFGNATRNGVDTGHQIFNQATSTTINGGPSADNIANTHMTGVNIVPIFKDSSSANSIHHALVSGGGIHHTKAVTLKSDGTNGTSTTDHNGNTIFWCGSNSTVTFANSSSFDYGNTSFFHSANNTLYSGANADWDLAAQFTISMWVYIPSTQSGQAVAGLFGVRGDGYEGPIGFVASSSNQARVQFTADDGGSSPWHTQMNTTYGDFLYDNWNHVEFNRDANNLLTISINGIVKASATNSTNFHYSGSHALRIGRSAVTDSENQAMTGYMDEFMYMAGGNTPARFYLGNQAPATGATFNEFKYVDFDGSADYYSIPSTDTGYTAFDFNGTAKFTLAAWVWNDASSGVQHMFGNADASSPYHGWRFGMENGRFYSTMKGTSGGLDSFGVKAESGWQLAHALFDPAGAKITHYRNGVEGTSPNSSNATGDPTYSANMAPSIGGRDGTATQLFNGRMSQICVWNRHLTEAEIQAQFELGLTGNWKTSYSTGMVGYYNFSIADGTDTPSTSAFYDLSGNGYDMTGTSIAAVLTNYTPSNASKRLTHQPLAYTSNVQANTAVTGNTHYANAKPQSVNNSNFGSFVDDEYTVLLLRGGHGDGNTTFFDSNTAAGATITFPAHSHSFGKTRIAKTIATKAGNPQHEFTNEFGLHGTSLHFDGSDSLTVGGHGDDFNFGTNIDFTIEAWARVADGAYRNFVSTTSTSGNGGYQLAWVHGSYTTDGTVADALTLSHNNYTNALLNGGSSSARQDTWMHVALQRTGPRTEMFIDGICQASTETEIDFIADNNVLSIGRNNHDSDADYLDGYLDELRITKGIPRYTPDGASKSGIVPSTSTGAGSTGSSIPTSPYLRPTPYVATDGGRGYFSNTNVKLWIKSDTYPGDVNFIDSAGTIGNTPKSIDNTSDHTAANRPLIKTANSVTDYALSGGADGILFDLSDYIVVPNHESLQLSNSDFTIEFWIRAGSATSGIMGTCNSGVGRKGFRFHSSSSATVMNFWASTTDDSNEFTLTSPAVMVADHWHHVAQQRIGDEFNMIIDGVSAVRGSSSIVIPDNGNIYIGGTGSTAESELIGYLDEIRFSKMARYTSQGLIDSDFPNPSTEFGIQTEGSTYGRFDTQVTANTTYKRYNYQHGKGVHFISYNGTPDTSGTGTLGASIDFGEFLAGSPNGADPFCFAWWQKSNSAAYLGPWAIGASPHVVISAYSGGTTQDIYISDNGTGWNIHSGDTGAPPPIPGKWEFRAVSRQGANSIKFFHNGIVTKEITTRTDGTTAIGTLYQNSAATLRLGVDSSNNLFNGELAQWGFWRGKALSDAEIQDLYLAGPGEGVNWRTGTGISGTNYTSADGTGANLYLYFDMNNNPDDYTADTTSGTQLTDRSENGHGYMTKTSNHTMAADTKLLIHSNTDIDGDTSIFDSSPTEHNIARVGGGTDAAGLSDPKYANSGVNRSSLAGASYNGILFEENSNKMEYLKTSQVTGGPGDNFGTDNLALISWFKSTATGGNDYSAIIQTQNESATPYGVAMTVHGNNRLQWWFSGGTSNWGPHSSPMPVIADGTWKHIVVQREGTGSNQIKSYVNGTEIGSAGTQASSVDGGGGITVGGFWGGTDLPRGINGYVDQTMVIRGASLTSAQITSLYGGGNANTTIGALGGLIIHEEYANTTTTANSSTQFLLHSNNATHHTQGSRKFYNDIANTKFYGSGTFAATPAAAPKGHEAAGYFVVTVSATPAGPNAYNFQGNTHSSAVNDNPQVRLRRGYSYIFDFSDATNSGHQFYFANSTANSTGYAYGSGGTSGARPNAHLTGLFGTNADPNGAPAVTWTQLTATNFGDNSGTGDAYKYIKYEVPTDAPKNLYYRCSPHSAMGNAVFVMEATTPEPIKVAKLPSLRTSEFNDRDYAGIGTYNSVIGGFDGTTSYLTIPDSTDWDFGTGNFSIELWAWLAPGQSEDDNVGLIHSRSGGSSGWSLSINDLSNPIKWYDSGAGSELTNHVHDTHGRWSYIVIAKEGTGANQFKLYVNGVLRQSAQSTGSVNGTDTLTIGREYLDTAAQHWSGFMDQIMIYKGSAPDANTVIQNYMNARAGVHRTANSSCVLHIKADSTYGDTTFIDASPSAHTITSHGVYHHIEDDRTANTALYFDGYSHIEMTNVSEVAHGTTPFTYECWFKPTEAYASGQGVLLDTRTANPGAGYYVYIITQDLKWYDNSTTRTIADNIDLNVWHHVAITNFNTDGGKARAFLDGICKLEVTSSVTSYSNNVISIGRDKPNSTYYFDGWMDGIRITNGMPRYTSGIPTDGQSPAKDYDDGRSSNVSSNTWATSSTRRYYGINTHTYLQTTEYSTDANTVLLIRGDDAETANDGVNMYGDNGFHLEFKEVGSGDERDYNNFNTGVSGLGSDTSATAEFADDATLLLVRSRPNQANGSVQFINEVNQSRGNALGTTYHDAAQSIFSIDANTANVSVSSGGSGTY